MFIQKYLLQDQMHEFLKYELNKFNILEKLPRVMLLRHLNQCERSIKGVCTL